jgi:uncharacterized membrane protein
MAAQSDPLKIARHPHYKLIDMGTFGGPSSYFNTFSIGPQFGGPQVLNARAALTGWADTSTPDPYAPFCFNPDCFVSHAFRWQNGSKTDLGVLPGGASSEAFWISPNGLIAGNSQNGAMDPLVPGLPEVRGVLWQQGKMIELETLGGNESYAYAVNSRGEVVGIALNATPDPFSVYDLFFFNSSSGTQTRGVLWHDGIPEDLGDLGGPDTFAAFVNESGQVAGFSFINSTPNQTTSLPTFHPFLWDRKKGMQDLGTLGGTLAQAVNGLNERGQVVGSTTLAGDVWHDPFLWDGEKMIDIAPINCGNTRDGGEADWINDAGEIVGIAAYPASCGTPSFGRAFLWREGVLTYLGTTAGMANSEGVVINNKTQIVGYSFPPDLSSLSLFLWEEGSIVDLNTLIPSDSGFYLLLPADINDRGEIAAFGSLPNGDVHAVLLIPCDENHPNIEGCDYSLVDETATATDSAKPATQTGNTAKSALSPDAIRQLMQAAGRRSKPWYRGLGAQPQK